MLEIFLDAKEMDQHIQNWYIVNLVSSTVFGRTQVSHLL